MSTSKQNFEEQIKDIANAVERLSKEFGEKVSETYKNMEPTLKKTKNTVIKKTSQVVDELSQTLKEAVRKLEEVDEGLEEVIILSDDEQSLEPSDSE